MNGSLFSVPSRTGSNVEGVLLYGQRRSGKAIKSTDIGSATRRLEKTPTPHLKGLRGHTRGVVPLCQHASDIDARGFPSILTGGHSYQSLQQPKGNEAH